MRRKVVSILGGRAENCGRDTLAFAEHIGRELGRRGYALASGGDNGVASAAFKGAVDAGADTIALLKWNTPQDCGDYTTIAIPTSMDLARSNLLNWVGDGIIAFDGRYGTMGEIALALDTERPLVVTGHPALINHLAFDTLTCRFVPGNSLSKVQSVVDTLEELMNTAVVPPSRPAAPPGLA